MTLYKFISLDFKCIEISIMTEELKAYTYQTEVGYDDVSAKRLDLQQGLFTQGLKIDKNALRKTHQEKWW